jgi:hypothetical protein
MTTKYTPEARHASAKRFLAWAEDAGYDAAHTYDTDRSRWVMLNPMTADLWRAWCAALAGGEEQPKTNTDADTKTVHLASSLAKGSTGLQPKRLGFMYMGRRPCGRVSASAWDDPGHEKSTAAFVANMIRKGLDVQRVERFEGDALPEWICDECRGKPCKDAGGVKASQDGQSPNVHSSSSAVLSVPGQSPEGVA